MARFDDEIRDFERDTIRRASNGGESKRYSFDITASVYDTQTGEDFDVSFPFTVYADADIQDEDDAYNQIEFDIENIIFEHIEEDERFENYDTLENIDIDWYDIVYSGLNEQFRLHIKED